MKKTFGLSESSCLFNGRKQRPEKQGQISKYSKGYQKIGF